MTPPLLRGEQRRTDLFCRAPVGRICSRGPLLVLPINRRCLFGYVGRKWKKHLLRSGCQVNCPPPLGPFRNCMKGRYIEVRESGWSPRVLEPTVQSNFR
ncbi:hypothetical protein BHE74_00019306 [Ensete ventricosum]|nr:hypothetical protein GW17_00001116 [Ensete ventricosum]RWW72854.1 hypothetical protein BHE74_00019306 [Ensete ventricosum]